MRTPLSIRNTASLVALVSAALLPALLTGACGRSTGVLEDRPPESAPPSALDGTKDDLSTTVSRLQNRIEELDAKISTLSDKLDSTRNLVENSAGKQKPASAVSHAGPGKEAPVSPEISQVTLPSAAVASVNAPSSDEALQMFSHAMQLFKAGKYSDSELEFHHFTESYPEHVLAGSAQYYAGESYFSMKEYRLALNEYQMVIASFSSSPRVSSALVRIAHCQKALGRDSDATRTMVLAKSIYQGNPSLDMKGPDGIIVSTNAPPSPPTNTSNDGFSNAPTKLDTGPIDHAVDHSEVSQAPAGADTTISPPDANSVPAEAKPMDGTSTGSAPDGSTQ